MPQTAPESRHVVKLRAFIDSLTAIGADKLVKGLGLEPDAAKHAMLAVANSLCETYKGQTFYVPNGVGAFRSAKHEAIRERYATPATGPDVSRPFTSERIEELALEFGLSERMVRVIVSRRQTELARQAARTT